MLLITPPLLGGCVADHAGQTRHGESFSGRTPEDILEPEILLTKAADAGNVDAVRRLLDQGADPDGLSGTKARRYLHAIGRPGDWHGIQEPATPLLALFGYDWDESIDNYVRSVDPVAALVITKLLLEAGADPDLRGGMGGFALMDAIQCGALDSARLLIESGANVDLSLENYTQIDIHRADPTNVLAAAIRSRKYEIIPLLLEEGVDPYDSGWGMNALQRCAYQRDPKAMRILFEYLDKNYSADAYILRSALVELIEADIEGIYTPPEDLLREQANWFDCFRMLVERGAMLEGARVRYPSLFGDIELPIFQAWFQRAARQGLDKRPEKWPNMENLVCHNEDITPLREALAQGMNPNRTDYTFGTPDYHPALNLFYACDDPEIEKRLRLLFEAGMDPMIRDDLGQTLLHHAAFDSNEKIIRMLVEFGVDINALDNDGLSPLDYASGGTAEKLERTEALIRELGGKPGQEANPREPIIITTDQATAKADDRLPKLMRPVDKRAVLEQLIEEQRYFAPADPAALQQAEGFVIGRVRKYEMPQGPPMTIVYDSRLDERGRSDFVCFRGDGAMLPRRAGETWRLGPEDVVDIDGDGFVELLIDATLQDEKTKLGMLRIVSVAKAESANWVVLIPHRDEPGAFTWQLSDEHFRNKNRKIEFGPMGNKDEPLWVAWTLQYNDTWLQNNASERRGPFAELFVQTDVMPCALFLDEEAGLVEEHALDLAQWLYPMRYR